MRRYLLVVAIVVGVLVLGLESTMQVSSALGYTSLSLPSGATLYVINTYGYSRVFKAMYVDTAYTTIMTDVKGLVYVLYLYGSVSYEMGLASDIMVLPNDTWLYDMVATNFTAVNGDYLCIWYPPYSSTQSWTKYKCIPHGLRAPLYVDGAKMEGNAPFTICVSNATYTWCYRSPSGAFRVKGVFRPVVVTDGSDVYAVLIGTDGIYIRGNQYDVYTYIAYSSYGAPPIPASYIVNPSYMIARGGNSGQADVLYMGPTGIYFVSVHFDLLSSSLITRFKYFPYTVAFNRYVDSLIVDKGDGKYYAVLSGFLSSDLILVVANITDTFKVVNSYDLPSVIDATIGVSESGRYFVLAVNAPSLSFTSPASTIPVQSATTIPTTTPPVTVTQTLTTTIPTTVISTVTNTQTLTTTVTNTQTVFQTLTTTMYATVTTTYVTTYTTTSVVSTTIPTTVTQTLTTTIPTTVTSTATIPTTVTTTVGGSTTTYVTTYITTYSTVSTVFTTVTTTYSTVSTISITRTTAIPTTVTTVIGYTATVTVISPIIYRSYETETVTTTVTRGFAFSYDVLFAVVAVALLALAIVVLLKHKHH